MRDFTLLLSSTMVTMGANSVRMCLQRFHTAIEVSKLHLALLRKLEVSSCVSAARCCRLVRELHQLRLVDRRL